MFKRKISPIHGFGIFSEAKIPEGEKFYRVPLEIICDNTHPRFARIGKGRYVCDELVLNWINHSCNSNARLDTLREDPVLIALRDILPNEEITLDYSQTEENNNKIKCKCGYNACRKYFYIS